jgi:hypothetical protein
LACLYFLIHFQRNNLIGLILHKIAPHPVLPVHDQLNHLHNLNPTNNTIGTGNGGHNIASHILHLIKRLRFDIEAVHAKVGGTGDEMDYGVVVFLELD